MENETENSFDSTIPAGGIPVAIDTNMFIYLEQLVNPRFDPNNEIKDALRSGRLYPSLYKDKRFSELPPLLQNKYLGLIEKYERPDGKVISIYSKLLDVYHLYEQIISGKIHPYLTPTAYREVKYMYLNSCMKKYCTVVKIPDDKFEDFKQKRNNLAIQYVLQGAMKAEWNSFKDENIPSNDSVIMAEASVFGLILITANIKDFIDNVKSNGDYDRADSILAVNMSMGYIFEDNRGNKVGSIPMAPATFYKRFKFLTANSHRNNLTLYLHGDEDYLGV